MVVSAGFVLHGWLDSINVTGSEKRGHFMQVPNFGFKTFITLKL